MILLILAAVLSVNTAFQGEIVNLTLEDSYYVVLDQCMYFEETLTNATNLSAGTHPIHITYSCEGSRSISLYYANKTLAKTLQIEVKKVEDPYGELQKLDGKILELKKKMRAIRERMDYLEDLVNTLNSINVELYTRLKKYESQLNDLEAKLEEAKKGKEYYLQVISELNSSLKHLRANYTLLKDENEKMKAEIADLQKSVDSLSSHTETFKTLFFLSLALLVGSYFSIMRR